MIIKNVIFFFLSMVNSKNYTLSLHDALPILPIPCGAIGIKDSLRHFLLEWVFLHGVFIDGDAESGFRIRRSEEHTSELQSPCNIVCRLLLEKKTFLVEVH